MPANQKINRKCTCTPCKQTPQGYRLLKYQTWYRHRVKEENLQALAALRAAFRSNIHTDIPANPYNGGQGELGPAQPEEQAKHEPHEAEFETGIQLKDGKMYPVTVKLPATPKSIDHQ
ncbi:unnamed protein product, partial [Rhizoctonia solani]